MIRTLVEVTRRTRMAGACPGYGSGVSSGANNHATRSVATTTQKTFPHKTRFENTEEEANHFRDVSVFLSLTT